jgi:hypothetical protein
MFQRVHQYDLVHVGGHSYRPRAYAAPQSDGAWDGWLVFFPLAGGAALAPPDPETTQSSLADVALWAAALTPVYLEGALVRAIELAEEAPIIGRLRDAEYEALHEAERLETAAAAERTAADLDEAAARVARADAEDIHRERLATEDALAATEEAVAKVEAGLHEQAARDARAIAADAKRRRAAKAEATPRQPKRRGGKRST